MQDNLRKLNAGKRRREKIKKFCSAMFGRRVVIIGAAGFLIFVFVAVFASVLSPYDPNETNAAEMMLSPSIQHLLGTDQYGRDTLTRLFFGARVSLIVGVLAVAIGCVIGVFLGLCAAYFGGWADAVIMRVSEAVMSIPRIMLSLAMIAIMGNSIADLAVILAIPSVPTYVRMIRVMALQIKTSDYVRAAQMQGGRSLYIMLRHVLPNSISPVIILMMQNVGMSILMEASLSFLGIGISIPIASWGSMVNDGKAFLMTNPVLAIAPGLCVALLVICLNMLGDGIRDAMDPRLRGEV